LNTVKFDAAVTENMGNVRKNNEDNLYLNGIFLTADTRDISASFISEYNNETLVYGVFDGMGGEALGEEASLLAASSVHEIRQSPAFDQNPEQHICAAIELANDRICDKMRETGERRIGTTFASVIIKNDTVRAFNVGDSRIYLFRDGVLSQLSVDDTNGQRLLNMGVITPEQLATHPDRHKLTQHLGIFKDEMTIEPHISSEIPLMAGDKILICSDGLTDMVNDRDIAAILSVPASAVDTTQTLVTQALANGGRDNVTAMVITAVTSPERSAYIPPVAAQSHAENEKGSGKTKNIILLLIIGILTAAVVVLLVMLLTQKDKAPQANDADEDDEAFEAEISVITGGDSESDSESDTQIDTQTQSDSADITVTVPGLDIGGKTPESKTQTDTDKVTEPDTDIGQETESDTSSQEDQSESQPAQQETTGNSDEVQVPTTYFFENFIENLDGENNSFRFERQKLLDDLDKLESDETADANTGRLIYPDLKPTDIRLNCTEDHGCVKAEISDDGYIIDTSDIKIGDSRQLCVTVEPSSGEPLDLVLILTRNENGEIKVSVNDSNADSDESTLGTEQ